MKFGILASWKWNWRPLSKVRNVEHELKWVSVLLHSNCFRKSINYMFIKKLQFSLERPQKIIMIKNLSKLIRGYNIYTHNQIQRKCLIFITLPRRYISTLKYRHFHTRVTDLERDHFEYWHVCKQLPHMTQEPLGQYRILLKAFNILWLQI